jgi:hypothetical protein
MEWFLAMLLESHQRWELELKEEEGVFLDQKFIHVSKQSNLQSGVFYATFGIDVYLANF